MTLAMLAIAILAVVTFGYVGMCAGAPFTRCRRCNGFGFATTTDRKGRPQRGKSCRRCKATGLRVRLGRRAWNAYHRTHHNGTR